MKLLIVCQAVDENDPIVAGTISWIDEFSRHPEVSAVDVVTLRAGRHDLPANVRVAEIAGGSRARKALSFLRTVARECRDGFECCFIYQGGPYALLLLPWRATGKLRVYQWLANPLIGRRDRVLLRLPNAVFTSTERSLPGLPKNVRVLNQAIDVRPFANLELRDNGDFCFLGRVAPDKRIEDLLVLLQACKAQLRDDVTLTIYGPCDARNEPYRVKLGERIEQLALQGNVRFAGPIKHAEVPRTLARYRGCLNFGTGAIDRATLEAWASGTPVLTTNDRYRGLLPPNLAERFVVPPHDLDAQLRAARTVLESSALERAQLAKELRDLVARNHSLPALIARIVETMRP